MSSTKLGPYRIDVVNDGILWLDGGAMFGVVPRPLWSRLIRPDERNRIPLATNCLLVRGPCGNVLVDSGLGDHGDENKQKIFNFQHPERRLIDQLADLGVSAQDVDVVVQTHLHFDHCGALARPNGDGTYKPNFPNARIVVQEAEWEAALQPDARTRPSYYTDAFWRALEASGNLRLIEGAQEVAPGIFCRPIGGHSMGHQIVEVRHGDRRIVFLGDFIPQFKHLGLPYIMAYDLFPLRTLGDKQRFLPEAVEKGWIVVFEHDHELALATLHSDGGKVVARPLENP